MAEEKKPKLNEEKLMAKVLKTEVECTFLGNPAILVPILWKEDLVISSMIADFVEEAQRNGVGGAALDNARRVLNIAATIRFALKKKVVPEGRIREEVVHMFKDMDTLQEAARDNATWEEMCRLFGVHYSEFVLTDQEKKS